MGPRVRGDDDHWEIGVTKPLLIEAFLEKRKPVYIKR
jgi:hypothetical protein